ncbi:hypothetical protein JHK86_009863 [Glycine max]|nr:hypothetical protein JHK86_009863 [Glycine max]
MRVGFSFFFSRSGCGEEMVHHVDNPPHHLPRFRQQWLFIVFLFSSSRICSVKDEIIKQCFFCRVCKQKGKYFRFGVLHVEEKGLEGFGCHFRNFSLS